jgi:putative membrane protein
MMNLKLIFSLVLTCLVVLFVSQNVAVVEIRFMFWQLSMSRSLLIFFLLATGIMVGWLMHSLFVHRANKDNDEKLQNSGLEGE